jgi:hypothetical protein
MSLFLHLEVSVLQQMLDGIREEILELNVSAELVPCRVHQNLYLFMLHDLIIPCW